MSSILEEALNFLDVKDLNYSEWIKVGQAVKSEGLPCSVWDEWSSSDSRYEPGECSRKWETFKSDEVKGGTIVFMAKERGFVPTHKEQELPEDDVIRFLSALYKSDESVNIVVDTKLIKNKYVPSGYGVNWKAGDLIKALRGEDIKKVLPGLNDASGAWIRANPTDGRGVSDANVTAYKYALVESDNLPLDEQKRLIKALNLPVATLVYSGGKSLHALVKVDAGNESEYKTRVSFLHQYCKEHGLDIDTQNKNPSRLTRLPGVMRGDKKQSLLAVNMGAASWEKWAAQIAQEEKLREWEEPVPFDEQELPPFPVDALPPALGNYCQALAESTQTPVDMASVCSLAVVAVTMQGRYVVRVNPDWKEPVNIFVACVMRPSERKSAVQAAVCEPLDEYEKETNDANKKDVVMSRSKKNILEARQRKIETAIASGKGDEQELECVAKELANFKEVVPLRLYAADITPEALSSVMAAQGGKAAILSSEGGIFDIISGAYSKNVNIDIFLKGHSGDSIRVDRVGRPSEFINDPALTISLMLQPSVLESVMNNPTFRGRGLTARFLYAIPKSAVGGRKYKTAPIDNASKDAYWDKILEILEEGEEDTQHTIVLSEEADKLLEKFSEELEVRLPTEYEPLEGWAGKLAGNVVRISGLLWRAGKMRAPVIDGETMADAIRVGRYFLAHAVAAFGIVADMQNVKRALSAIESETEFTKRDILRRCRTFKTAEDAQRAIDVLENYGYVRQKSSIQTKGRPTTIYEVNPLIKR